MKSSFLVTIVLILSILLTACYAQTTANFQGVGGDYGRAWLKNFLAENPDRQPKAQNSTTLWNWGGAPKGRVIQNGSLVADPYYIWKSFNLTSGWLGQAYIDPTTGYPVYAYVDPYTGYPDYFYVDPKTGTPVYINSGTTAENAGYGNAYPYHWPYVGVPTSSNYPWLGDASDLPPYGSAAEYGGLGMS
jgi:predicted small secreted protein